MTELVLINIGWNTYNGFLFELVTIDTDSAGARALLGVSASTDFLYISLFFLRFTIYE